MKKAATIGLTLVIFIAMSIAPVLAGPNCGASAKSGKSCLKTCGVEVCKGHTKTDAGNKEEHKSHDYNGKCEVLSLKIKGTIGDDCETKITEALKSEKGVIKVCAVDPKANSIMVCFYSDKTKSDRLTEMIEKTGYRVVTASVSKDGCTHSKDNKCAGHSDKNK